MLKLRASEQEPLSVLISFSIACLCRLQVINYWNGVFRLLLGTLLFVVLNNLIAYFNLLLMSLDLIGGKHVLTHDGENRLNISRGEVVFGHAEVLNSSVSLKHSD